MMRLGVLAFLVVMGACRPSTAVAVSPPPAREDGADATGYEVVASWRITVVTPQADPAMAQCTLAPEGPAAHLTSILCAAGLAEVGAQVVQRRNGTCAIQYAPPACPPDRMCDPRPSQVVDCPVVH